MRVLLFTNMWPKGEDPYGSFVATQVEDLRRAGVDVSLLAFDARAARTRYVSAARELRRRVEAEPVDLVHAHYGLSGLAARAQRRVPIVTTFHGSDAYIPWQRRLSRVAAAGSAPICVSREIALLVGRPDADVIPMGVDTELFAPLARDDAKRELGLDPGRTYVLFPAARTNPIKRHDLFAAAVSQLDVEPVTFEGYDRRRAGLLLNAVDVVLLTSEHEGSPLTVREALACDTPVVSVAVGDVPEVLAGLPDCAIAPAEASALARAVERSLAAERGGERRRRALETSRAAVAQRVLAVYGRVA